MARFGLFLMGLLLLVGCSGRNQERAGESARVVLEVWAHEGRESERQTLLSIVRTFHDRQDETRIHLTFLPEGAYNSQVQAASLAGELPDILEFDGPFLYSYAWQGHVRPLEGLVSADATNGVIPSILQQGAYRGKLYSLGMFDSGLGLYARKNMLRAIGARIPQTPEEAWSVEEFETILKKLSESDPDGKVLDLKLNYGGEWFTYGFSPILQSAGADLIDRSNYATCAGVLNSPESVAALERVQEWVYEKKYVDANVDDDAFTGGRVAFSWVGHWEYRRYSAAHGDDLLLLPLPDFGNGTRTGQGSWSWGITETCRHPEDAGRFIGFLMDDERVLEMADSNAAVPATRGAIVRSALYRKGSPLRLFAVQLTEDYAVPRPRTPAYPVITSVFQEAFRNIINGADVQTVLNKAVEDIDRDIIDNKGYPSIPSG